MTLYNQILPEFEKFGAEVLGVSVDQTWCHAAFAHHHNIHFPRLADIEPEGGVARSHVAYRDREDVSERALFVVDNDGAIFWSYVSPITVNPGADGIFDALERLAQGDGAPAPIDRTADIPSAAAVHRS